MKKKIKTNTIYRFNALPPGITGNDSSGKGFRYSCSTFNEAGQLLTEERFNEHGEVEEKYENKYDENGRLIEERTYLNETDIAEHKTYERGDDGQILRAFKHYQDGDKDTIHYNRDNQGRLIEKITIDSYQEVEAREIINHEDDKVRQRKVYEYDDLVLDETYTYDPDGNMIEHSKWTIEEENSRFLNEFDARGNMIRALKYDLKDNLLVRMEYTYEGGNLVRITEENPYGSSTTTILYDEKGNPVEQVELDQNGEANNKAARKYNDNNDVVESEIFINYHGRGINQHYFLKFDYEYFG